MGPVARSRGCYGAASSSTRRRSATRRFRFVAMERVGQRGAAGGPCRVHVVLRGANERTPDRLRVSAILE